MEIQPGSKLGHYEIVALLGAGGMGEVYRAHDPKLDREVAIKVLPDDFASDPERLARFEREAKSLAALNHPNIATVFGFEQDGDTHFLVMELASGEDLAERLRRGPIPIDEATPLFVQIAEGLEAAHEQGIVHRDLKPANIVVTDEGRVKILDFGLAKALVAEPSQGDPEMSISPTLTLAATRRGEILGTAPYMSPEQARGKAVDERTDIWAFGACLFEVLSGKRVFEGDNAAMVLASVLKDEPPWRELPADLPPSVRRLLRRCLARKRRNRLSSIADARLELLDSETEELVTPTVSASRRPHWTLAAVAALGLVVGVVGLVAAWQSDRARPGAETLHMTLSLPDDVEIPYFHLPSLAISPDGHKIAFMGESNGATAIWVDDLRDSDPARAIDDSERGTAPFFSPDSQQLGWVSDRIVTVPLAGGDPVRRASMRRNHHNGVVWASDGSIWFGGSYFSDVQRLDSAGEMTTVVSQSDELRYLEDFEPLPGGRYLLSYAEGPENSPRVVAIDLESGQHKTLFEGGFEPRYVPTGHLLVAQNGVLLAMTFDPSTLTTGSPVPVLSGLITDGNNAVAQYALSDEGTLVFLSGTEPEARETSVVEVVPAKEPVRLSTEPIAADYVGGVSVSPDGRWLAYQSKSDLYLFDLERGRTERRLTRGGGNEGFPVWSSRNDLAYIAEGREEEAWALAGRNAADWERERVFVSGPSSKWASSWSPDGGTLFFQQSSPETQGDLWQVEIDGDREAELLLRTAADERTPTLSPDGRWLAFVSDAIDGFQIWVASYPDLGDAKRVTTSGGVRPRWVPRVSGSSTTAGARSW